MKKVLRIAFMVGVVAMILSYGYVVTYANTSDTPDYMRLMIENYINGDFKSLKKTVLQRNKKIKINNLEYETIDFDDFVNNFSSYAGFDPNKDYTAEIIKACLESDIEFGRQMVRERNKKIEWVESEHNEMDFDDVLLLSKVIQHEAGSKWLSIDWKMKIGEVLLNRVESPEFPNTLYECVYAKGQYSGAQNGAYDTLTLSEDSIIAAVRLLNGERVINNKAVVFQSNSSQGSNVYEVLSDEILGNTYLCYSHNLELYKSGDFYR